LVSNQAIFRKANRTARVTGEIFLGPIRINGLWDDGYALDFHTIRSDFLGYDELGHAQFDTEYTELGNLLHKLKYGGDASGAPRLAEAAAGFVRSWSARPEVIIPVPPSRVRAAQPLMNVAQRIAKDLDLILDVDSLRKTRDTPQLKGIPDHAKRVEALEGAFAVQGSALANRRILLFDDLFRSGATMNAITKVLRFAGVSGVFTLTLTRTRTKT